MAEDDDDLVLPQNVRVPLSALHFEYSRGSGPGGQNVNKVNSKVTLRLDILNASFLRPEIRDLLLLKLATRITTEGVLVLHSSEHRDQPRNREAAVARLEMLLREALHRPRTRKATRPTRGSVERRLKEGRKKSETKRLRRKPGTDD